MKQEENGREAAGTVGNGTVAAGSCAFRRFSENFANSAKWAIFATQKFFAKALFLAKIPDFATHENFAKLEKFR